MIRAIVFDLDDTLYPESQFVQSGFRAVDRWLHADANIDGFYEVAWRLFQQGGRKKVFDEALRRLGREPDPGLISQLVGVYRGHYPEIELHSDAASFLSSRPKQLKYGLVTDGYLVTQRNKVSALGIAEFFDCVVYSDEFGRENWKPSEVPFLKIEERLGIRGGECVYVADNPKKDFIAPRKLGWKTVKIRRNGGEYANVKVQLDYEADHCVECLIELMGLVCEQQGPV